MKKIITVISLSIIYIFFLLFIFIPKKNFSELENKALSVKPIFSISNITNGKFMEDWENYISDHFPLKDYFLFLKTSIYRNIGIDEINDVFIAKNDYLIENYFKIDNKDSIAKSINRLAFNTNAKVYTMLIPNKIAIYKDFLPKNLEIVDQHQEINELYKMLKTNNIDAYSELKNNNDKYLYYKTDHHWTTLGAYYGYKAFQQATGDLYYSYGSFNVKNISKDFLGSSYSKVLTINQAKDNIDIVSEYNNIVVNYQDTNKKTNLLYNYDYLNKKDKYSLFLDNNHSLITIINSDVNDRSLLIIKDSFANSMIPFLVKHYNRIDIVDPRYYKKSISKYVKENNIDDILIIYNLATLSTDRNIESIR